MKLKGLANPMFPSYEFIERTASEIGFQLSPLEKVILLGDFAGDVARHPFLGKVLVLKGGTALNLCFGPPSRLSVDLDYNYIGHLERNEMLEDRQKVEDAILELAKRKGYLVQWSADSFAGRKVFLTYASALGINDRIEIDLNFIFRLPLKEPGNRVLWQPGGLDRPSVRTVSMMELIVGKLLALIDRVAVRDVWDIGRLSDIDDDVLQSSLFRSYFIAMSATLNYPLYNYKVEKLKDRIDETVVTQELVPLLTTDETALVEDRIARAWHLLGDFLSLSKNEKEYVTAVSGGDLALKLLFPSNSAEVEHLTKHPALAWKIKNVRARLDK
jgi:predicted nucleotidyltransferase component of viral defense system